MLGHFYEDLSDFMTTQGRGGSEGRRQFHVNKTFLASLCVNSSSPLRSLVHCEEPVCACLLPLYSLSTLDELLALVNVFSGS